MLIVWESFCVYTTATYNKGGSLQYWSTYFTYASFISIVHTHAGAFAMKTHMSTSQKIKGFFIIRSLCIIQLESWKKYVFSFSNVYVMAYGGSQDENVKYVRFSICSRTIELWWTTNRWMIKIIYYRIGISWITWWNWDFSEIFAIWHQLKICRGQFIKQSSWQCITYSQLTQIAGVMKVCSNDNEKGSFGISKFVFYWEDMT